LTSCFIFFSPTCFNFFLIRIVFPFITVVLTDFCLLYRDLFVF
jgi:hypothetical protein